MERMKKSIWEMQVGKFSECGEDKSCDICIVGGGLTGVSLAYYLRNSRKNVILIEQNKLGSSTTGRSTAKLTYLQKDLLSKIQKAHGYKKAREYYQAQRDAMNEVVRVIQQEGISCHLEKSPSYLFVREEKNRGKLQREFSLYKRFGAPISWKKSLPIPCGEKLACTVEDTYVFHPLEYLKGLTDVLENVENVQIYEHTRMIRYQKKSGLFQLELQTGSTIQAKILVFAGCYPPFILPYLFPIKVSLDKEVVRTEKFQNQNFNAINLDSDIFSIRFFENQKIQVVSSKQLGNSAISEPITVSKSGFSWSNYDVMTPDALPIVGFVGSGSSGLYLASGYNAWGMTNSNLAARVLASDILGEKHCYTKLCNPYRHSFSLFLGRCLNAISNLVHFVASYFPNSSPAHVVWRNGKRVGVVVDTKGVQHEVLLTCPHMKCGLRYNPYEETWDCPCHGSRFDLDGKLLRGPATSCVQVADRKE